MDSLLERSSWAINYVVRGKGLSNKKIAAAIGIGEETVAAYRNKRTAPKVRFIVEFCEKYGFDLTWFASGKGEPFRGARKQFPEICGDPLVKEGVMSYNGQEIEKQVFCVKTTEAEYNVGGFGEAVDQLREIYDYSDPDIIAAIQANLATFLRTVRREKEVIGLKDRLFIMEKRMKEFEEKISQLTEVGKGNPKPEPASNAA